MKAKPLSAEESEMERLILEIACEMSNEELRRAFLTKVYQVDPAGLARIQALVVAAHESAAFFQDASQEAVDIALEILHEDSAADRHSLVQEAVQAEAPGSCIGRYRLLGRIGQGGGGVVYEAEQEGELRRPVAVKLFRSGIDTEAVIERFRNEIKALALMEHPNIAGVFDSGVTETGRPFFVMELVRGKSITDYCNERRMALSERISIFIDVCRAIQNAHQKGVIHRDIKPSNVLVASQDGKPVLKVIDFGIATINSPFGEAVNGTDGRSVGTPAYMSPEQVDLAHADVDTRSDVYSLGALLFELITGTPPFDSSALLKLGPSAMRRKLLESIPPLPSARLEELSAAELSEVAIRCGTRPARLIAQARSDLDWIVGSAMQKDRNRRYSTANDLAVDLKRFLDDMPVSARPGSRRYSLGKFVRRNRVMCAAGVIVAVTLIAGAGVSTLMFLRERMARHAQQHLRMIAEAARESESQLHQRAENMARLFNAAALLSLGKVAEADEILKQTPVASVPPSWGAADVFRALGEANAIHSRWKEAAECFDLLMQSNTWFTADQIWGTGDLLRPGPAMLEAGEAASYERSRRELVARFGSSQALNTADQMLKVSLLTPAGPEFLMQLRPAADLLREALADAQTNELERFRAWYRLALALYELRSGNAAEAIGIAEATLAETRGVWLHRDASLHACIAIASGANNTARAAREIAHAHESLAKLTPTPTGLPGVGMIVWEDCAIARILIREAEAMLPR